MPLNSSRGPLVSLCRMAIDVGNPALTHQVKRLAAGLEEDGVNGLANDITQLLARTPPPPGTVHPRVIPSHSKDR